MLEPKKNENLHTLYTVKRAIKKQIDMHLDDDDVFYELESDMLEIQALINEKEDYEKY